jgi:aldehyde dehydrogenase (NAD+)
MADRKQHFINGSFVAPDSGKYIETFNPHNQEKIAELARGNGADVERAVNAASEALDSWARLAPSQRGRVLKKLADLIVAEADTLGALESEDMGMPTKISPDIMLASAEFFEYYGGLAPSLLGDTLPTDETKMSYTRNEPFGVVAIITPWNGPLNQAARSIAPALAVGNTVVLKPSEWGSLTCLRLGQLAKDAGLPDGVLNILTGFGTEVGTPLVEHPLVSKVAFTGSIATGQVIGKIAAQKIMPVTLELGGKSPNIVFEDADLAAALPMVLYGFTANSGQICSSGTRVLVQRSIYADFCEQISRAAKLIPIGRDEPFPCLGPMANEMQYQKVLSYFESAVEEGATVVTGGKPAAGEGLEGGLYIEPTVFADVSMDMRIVKEEIFGPAGILIPFDTEEEAIQIANDTHYGLCSGLWTQNLTRAHRVAARIQAGTVYINTYHDQTVDAPVGGYKMSGIGRERGVQALKQYTQLKNVTIDLT